MGANTKIEWCDFTFNCWRGCTKVSPGCAHCYAETLSGRNPKTLGMWGPSGTRVVAAEAQWKQPVKWNKAVACNCLEPIDPARDARHRDDCPQASRPRVFCASLADVFEDWQGPMVDAKGNELMRCTNAGCTAGGFHDVDFVTGQTCEFCQRPTSRLTMQDVRARLFALIDATPNLDWLVLTKRPENVAEMMPDYKDCNCFVPQMEGAGQHSPTCSVFGHRPNLWLGASVENQQTADERIPHLLKTPAAVWFLSCEPLLGPVDLMPHLLPPAHINTRDEAGNQQPIDSATASALSRVLRAAFRQHGGATIDWVIVGGESGPGARPCEAAWIRSIIKQCHAANVACFVKQVGAFVVDRNDAGYDALSEVWADGPNEGQPVDMQAWPDMPDIEDLDGTRDGYQGAPVRVRLVDRKGGNPIEWPRDLQVREFPKAVPA